MRSITLNTVKHPILWTCHILFILSIADGHLSNSSLRVCEHSISRLLGQFYAFLLSTYLKVDLLNPGVACVQLNEHGQACFKGVVSIHAPTSSAPRPCQQSHSSIWHFHFWWFLLTCLVLSHIQTIPLQEWKTRNEYKESKVREHHVEAMKTMRAMNM